MSKLSCDSVEQYREYVNLLKKYDYFYFVKSEPLVPDYVYDEYYFAVQDFESRHPQFVLPDSPTQKVSADGTDSKRTVRHRTPMMSTQKCKSVEDVVKWMKSTRKALAKLGCQDNSSFGIEWKYDGCSCSLVYQDGHLIEASTRGDYMNGQNILHHVMNIPSIPKVLNKICWSNDGRGYVKCGGQLEGRVEVRGEILMPFDNLEKTNGLYKDCRTASSALLNTDTATPYDALLTFRAWQMIAEEGYGYNGVIDSSDPHAYNFFVNGSFEYLEGLGFIVDGYECVTEDTIVSTIEYLTSERGVLPYPVDGIVIKINNKSFWDAMGRTEHHPKFCIAYKFPPATAETRITKIEITVGATGKRTPIIWFEPVMMNGKTYEKASAGSEDMVAKHGFAVGKRVQFSLANDVIPHIDKVIE